MKFRLKWFLPSLILNFLCLLTLIIHDPWIIRVKRQRNFILTWISFWPTTLILLGVLFWVWIISNYIQQKQWKTFAYSEEKFWVSINWVLNNSALIKTSKSDMRPSIQSKTSTQSAVTIAPHDTGQWISCFDGYQLARTWISNTKDVQYTVN